MSVPKNKRDLSELEFYHQALVIRKEITQLLLRDFGIKDKVRDIILSFNQMEKEDAEIFFDIAKKYNYNKVIEEYPGWLIDHCRNNLLTLCHNLIMNIASAYSINPVNLYECEQKRMSKDSIVRERRKLKRYKNLLDQGKMTYKDIEEAYGSWRGNLKNYLSYHTIQNMDKLYDNLFIKSMLEKE